MGVVIDKILSTTDWEIITLDRLDFSGNLNRLNEVVTSYDEHERLNQEMKIIMNIQKNNYLSFLEITKPDYMLSLIHI